MAKLTVPEAAARLARNPKLVRRWLTEGKLKGGKFGPVWMVDERELARFRKNEPERRERRAKPAK